MCESLEEQATVRLWGCGHGLHHRCLLGYLDSGFSWLRKGGRLHFKFLECPQCSSGIEYGGGARSVVELLVKGQSWRNAIAEAALERLEKEGLAKSEPKLKDVTSTFYGKPELFAMRTYAFYMCFKCRKPYFGGKRDCRAAAADEDAGADEKALRKKFESQICISCSGLTSDACKDDSHRVCLGGAAVIASALPSSSFHSSLPPNSQQDDNAWVFKCRFCCRVATWFCWGKCHFCDPCHEKWNAGKLRMATPKHTLMQCSQNAAAIVRHVTSETGAAAGKAAGAKRWAPCPLGVKHGINGTTAGEKMLKCGACASEQDQLGGGF